jgi:serine/threonine protein kinase
VPAVAHITAERYRRIRDVFDAALEESSAARDTFLRRACDGDAELERAVGNLLVAYGAAESFLETSPGIRMVRMAATESASGPAPAREFRETDRFTIVRRLGAGGFGVVYEAVDLHYNSVVALKKLHTCDGDRIDRFKREFRALADISHPNLAALYELFQDRDQWFFTMELVPGTNFLHYTAAAGSPARLHAAMGQLVDGVCALHELGKLHCDLKPDNVLVDRYDRVVILDFGLITEIQPVASPAIGGTPRYMSPEQAAGLPLSPASDWYSVGVMLDEALTRQDAPDGEVSLLRTLALELLDVNPSARPTGVEVRERLGSSSPRAATTPRTSTAPPRLVGRVRELDALDGALQLAASGRPVTALVHGSSGCGKSALIAHFAERNRQRRRCLVLEGRCHERESLPFKALDRVVEIIDRYLRTLTSAERTRILPAEIDLLARVFPVLRWAAPGSADREIADDGEVRLRAFRALLELVQSLAAIQPTVLILDDLQWGDADSALVLRALQNVQTFCPVLFVACYRDDELEESPLLQLLLCGGDNSARSVDIPVRELSGAGAVELASELLAGDATSVPEAAGRIARESGGNPLFIAELANDWKTFRTASPAPLLDEMLGRRISVLPGPARRLLEVVSIAGQPLSVDVATDAASLAGGGQGELVSLSVARLVRRRKDDSGERVEAYHDRIREVAVGMLDGDARRDSHLRLATAWEASAAPDCRALATHFMAGASPDKGKQYARQAAGQAADKLAFESAAEFYRLALQASPAGAADVPVLHRSLGDALSNAGRGREAADAYLAAARHAEGLDALDLERRAATQLMITGHVDESMPLVRKVAAAAGMAIAASPWRSLAEFVFWSAVTRIRALRRRERNAAEVDRQELLRVDVCLSMVQGLAMIDAIRAHPFQAKGIWLALRCGEPCRMSRALALSAGQLAIAGRRNHDKVERLLARAEELAQRGTGPFEAATIAMIRAIAAFLSGRWHDAFERFARAEDIFRTRCIAVHWETALCHMMSSVSLLLMGRLKTLGEVLPRVLREAELRGDRFEVTDLRIRLSHALALAADEPVRASHELEEAAGHWRTAGFDIQHWWALIGATEIDLYAGRADLAWSRMGQAWPRLRASLFLLVQYVRIESLQHRARAALALASSASVPRPDQQKLLARTRRDAARMQRAGAPWGQALAELLRAGVAAHAGRMDDASRLLERGEAACRACDMDLYAAAAQRMRGALQRGAAGRDLIAAADDWMRAQDIRDPERMAAMLVPGFTRIDRRGCAP